MEMNDSKVSAAMPSPVTDQQSYVAWLETTGRPVYSRYHGYVANYEVYKNYNLLSYGTPSMVPNNRYDSKENQYAIHGFSYDEYTVTNTYFRDDTTGVSDPRNWNNISLGQDSAVSWMRLSLREKEHIKNSQLFYSGKSFGGMTFANLGLTESKCVVIAIPSWTLGLALYTRHYNNKGEIRYGTLTGSGIGGAEIAGAIKPSNNLNNNIYTIGYNQDYLDIEFNIQSLIQNYTGLAKSTDIARGGIIFNNIQTESQGSGPWSTNQTIRYSRISTTPTKDFAREITVKSTIWAVSALGDLVSSELSYTFTLIEKAKVSINGILTIKGSISLFDGKKTMMGYTLPINPKRFLCLEKITMRIDFNCETVPDTVIFYPLGGKTRIVSVIKITNTTGYAQISYYMDIIKSSLTWSNVRVKPSYLCSARAYYKNISMEFVLKGIEITGDIYDLVYVHSTRK